MKFGKASLGLDELIYLPVKHVDFFPPLMNLPIKLANPFVNRFHYRSPDPFFDAITPVVVNDNNT